MLFRAPRQFGKRHMKALVPGAPARALRHRFALALAAVVIVGLASRRFPELLPGLLRKNTGDVLWATALTLACALAMPRTVPSRIATLCISISVAVEFSKFYDPSWLHRLRWSGIGRLLFGTSFSWSNLVCYGIGIALGIAIVTVTTSRTLAPVSIEKEQRNE
jgi:hypothetical protein